MTTRHYLAAMRTVNGVRSVLEIARWRRSGLLPIGHVAPLLHALVATNLDPHYLGTGNRARRRRKALEIVRMTPTPVGDVVHDTATEGYARRPFRTNPHE
jgi:hypothetical protein